MVPIKKSKPKSSNSNKPQFWDLTDIIAKGKFESLYKQAQKSLTTFKTFRKSLKPTMSTQEFKRIMLFVESFKEKLGRLGCYPELLLASNIKDQHARLLQTKVNNLSVQITDETLYLSQWIKGLTVPNLKTLDNRNAKRLFKAVPDLEFSLTRSRLAAKHTLKESEEKIIHRKDITGSEVIGELYDMIVNDFTYTFKVGSKATIIDNQQKLVSYVHSPKRSERKAAYNALFIPYKEHVDKFFVIYSALVKDWAQEAKLRDYSSSISMRNFANNVPDKAIEVLLDVCTKNRVIFHKYFRIKAKMLKLKKLERYDLYAPVTSVKEHFSFSDAKKLVFETFEEFSPSFAQKARSIVENGHLDSHPRANKRNGAFCMSITPSTIPYVLTNFDGKFRDVSTLAHELGHGIHDLYASNHSYSTMHAPLPVCETASTFGEMILFEKLLSKASKKQKVAMLMDKLGDSYATILRQNYFIKFELLAHKMLMKGCSEKELSDAYLKLLKEQLGTAVNVQDQFRYEWAYIPHIYHSPFYCYAYNFGELLSLALFARYKKLGPLFVPKIEKVLAAGGSQDPVKLLRSVGVDIMSPIFWNEGFTIIKEWLKELEKEV